VVRWIVRAVAGTLLAFLALTLLYRVIDPPLTPLMVREGLVHGIVRDGVALDHVSPALLRAVIAAEDAGFFAHRGIDWEAVRRAREYNARHGDEPRRGGSTITMQCARNVFLWQGKSYVRKALEAGIAYVLEVLWGKRRILEVYLNVAQLGPCTFGVEAASRRFFDKPASRLDASEAALLAAALPRPTDARVDAPSPWLRARAAHVRREMRRLGPDWLDGLEG
jgi:monofunctional biosynthetic peptidoglycan transglycosylase